MNYQLADDCFFALIGSRVRQSELYGRLANAAANEHAEIASNGAGLCLIPRASGSQTIYRSDGLLLVLQGHPRFGGRPVSQTMSRESVAAELCRKYRENPDNFLSGFVGTFRLVLLDERDSVVLFATDRLATLPIVRRAISEGVMAFASDSSLLLEISEAQAKLDYSAIYDYLFFHQIPSPRSIFVGVDRLLPAQLMTCRDTAASTKHYWEPDFRSAERGGQSPSKSELLEALERAVSETGPDDRTACFLSGGLDSSSVVGVLSKLSSSTAHAFTIGFAEPGYDEMEYARLVAKHFKLELHEYYLEPEDVASALPVISATYDEPFGNSSAVPTYFCARIAKEAGFSRLLAGDGGDELFAGNSRYAKQKLFQMFFRLPRLVREHVLSDRLLSTAVFRKTWPLRKVSRYVEQARQRLPDRLESANPLFYFENSSIFAPDFLSAIEIEEPYRLMRERYDTAPSDHFLNQMLWYDWKFTLTDNDLRKVGVMCRKAGVEVLYPMLDPSMIDLSVRIPPEDKLQGMELRSWYKSAVSGFLPEQVLAKKKHGFGLPFGEWLKNPGPMRDMAEESLGRADKLGIFREGFLAELRRRHQDVHAAHFGTLVWVIIMLEQWMSSRKQSL